MTDTTNTNEDLQLQAELKEFNQLPESAEINNSYGPYGTGVEDFGSNDFSWSQFLYKIDALPSVISEIFFDSNTVLFLEDIAELHSLSGDQSKNLSRIVRDILLGNIFIGDLVKEIQNKLKLDSGKAEEVANEIISDLFAPAIQEIMADQRSRFPDRIQALKKQSTGNQPSVTSNQTGDKSVSSNQQIVTGKPETQFKPLLEVKPQVDSPALSPEKNTIEALARQYSQTKPPESSETLQKQNPPAQQKTFSSPAASLDTNKSNVLDLRNKP